MKFINEHVCFDAFPKLPNHVTRLLGQNGGLSYLSTLSRWLGRAHKSLLRALKSIPVTREQHTSDGSLACVDMQGQWFGNSKKQKSYDAFPKLPNHATRLLGQNGGLSYLSTLSCWLGSTHKSILRALKSIPVTRKQHTSDWSLACVDMQGQWFGKLMTNVYLSNLWNRTKIKFRAAFKIMLCTLR